MAIPLKLSTASQEIPLGYFLDEDDGKTAEDGLTINNTDIKLWKHGATALANKNSGGATHIAGGMYYAVLDATDSNTLGGLVVTVHVAGALPVRTECVVLPAVIYDALIAGTDLLQVDLTQIKGATTMLNNLEDAFDGTGYTAALNIGAAASVTAEVTANVTKLDGSAADLAKFIALLDAATTAQAVTGTLTTTAFTTNLTEVTNDHYIGKTIAFITGALAGQGGKLVTDYVGSSKTITCDALTEAPANNDWFILL